MNKIRILLSCIHMLALIMFAGMASAQPASLQCATHEMNCHLVRSDTIGGRFARETNSLVVDASQWVISENTVTVGMLVRNVAGLGNAKGDYSAFWKGSTRTADRYTWVFVLKDFKQRCQNKGIFANQYNDQKRLSSRLCKLLGLDTISQRDTIVYMRVHRDDLFRPAYNPNVTRRTVQGDVGQNDSINSLRYQDHKWMRQQQLYNNYPWTRMGYTYDWGANDDYYVGVTEFILRPHSSFTDLRYTTITHLDTLPDN